MHFLLTSLQPMTFSGSYLMKQQATAYRAQEFFAIYLTHLTKKYIAYLVTNN
jgi:hypothetical protein